jgi:anti-anti-sigma factor
MKYETVLSAIPSLVRISGEVGPASSPELAELEVDLDSQPSVVVDVSELEYVDPVFLRFLLRLKKQPNKAQRKAIRLVGVSPRMSRLLEATGLSSLFMCEPAVLLPVALRR